MDYYWKEYTGAVPKDAFVAGHDVGGVKIYIGQAYSHNVGLVVVQIYPGQREVYVPYHGVTKIEDHIKILCGVQQKFYWQTVNTNRLGTFLINKHVVIGGHELGTLNIGRVSHEGDTRIGKITTFRGDGATFYCAYNGREVSFNACEILLYRQI